MNERLEKQAAYEAQQAKCNQRLDQGTAGYDATEPCQPSMPERLRDQLRRAQRESRKANNLEELVFLLDKNPEIARILDLIEITRF